MTAPIAARPFSYAPNPPPGNASGARAFPS